MWRRGVLSALNSNNSSQQQLRSPTSQNLKVPVICRMYHFPVLVASTLPKASLQEAWDVARAKIKSAISQSATGPRAISGNLCRGSKAWGIVKVLPAHKQQTTRSPGSVKLATPASPPPGNINYVATCEGIPTCQSLTP